MPPFVWTDKEEEPRKTKVRLAGVPPKIPTVGLPNANVKMELRNKPVNYVNYIFKTTDPLSVE
jgi:hypothetical protein